MKPRIAIKNYILFILFTTSFSIFGQDVQKHIDSVQKVLKNIASDSIKAKSYYNESRYFLLKSVDIKKSHEYIDSAMHYANISNYSEVIARSHLMYGLIYRLEGNYDEALKHLNISLENYKDDVKNKGNTLFQIAAIHKVKGQYEKSLKIYSEIFNLFEKSNDSIGMASTLNSIAGIYAEQNKNDKAIENYNESKVIFQKLNNTRSIALAYFNISLVYLNNKDTLKARENVLSALSLFKKVNDKNFFSLSLCRLGNTYFKSNPKKALANFLEAKTTLEKKGTKRNLIDLYQTLGFYYKYYNNNPKAIFYYNKAILLAEKMGYLAKQKDIYLNLSQIYKQKNNYKKAYSFQSKYIAVKDSLFDRENLKEINLLQTQFETEKKDKEIAEQKLTLQQSEATLQQRKNQYFWALGGSIFFLIASLGLWFFYKQRQKLKNKEIEALKVKQKLTKLASLIKGEEKERKRLAQDLHDGINGDLAVIKYKITTIETEKLNNTENQEFNQAVVMLDNAIEQVRNISHNLAPPSLQNFNLIEAIQQYCIRKTDSNPIKINFQNYGNFSITNKEVETAIYRIVQEAINNIVKHSKATEALVQINNHNNTIHLTIEDNGVGFDVTKEQNGLGLKNIQSRVDFLKGKLTLESNAEGTSIQIDIDLKEVSHD